MLSNLKLSTTIFCTLTLFLVFGDVVKSQDREDLRLWYDTPSGDEWLRALPIGNGRLGAMVYGNPAEERIQLNEDTVWSGSPHNNDSPDALEALPEVRRLIFEGEHAQAQELAGNTFFEGPHGMRYQPVGELVLSIPGHEDYSNYHRELNLNTAVATTRYTVDGIEYTREAFASAPDQVIVVRITSSRPGSVSLTASMVSPQQSEVTTENDLLVLTGTTGDHEGIPGMVRFESVTSIDTEGGTMSASGSTVEIEGADEVIIRTSIASNFNRYDDISGNEQERVRDYLDGSDNKIFADLLEDHVNDYRSLYDRVSLDLGTSDATALPTDERVTVYSRGDDPRLVELFFQYGRYLLISSSRPGTQPANLQGIWNRSMQPAWDSKYTLNINAEMNYWPAELTNLAELHEPLIRMVTELSESGRETAQTMYGADGWVVHHNTDLWRISGPVDAVYWGMWPMGGVWLSQHLWERYLYSGDESYLREVYPVMKSAAEFYLDFLVEEPQNGWLVVAPSNSPENNPESRPGVSIAAGATMDNQLLFDLFSNIIRAAGVLGVDEDFADLLAETRAQLPPMQIGRLGQLQEWMEDIDSPDDQHRHVSHLYGLHPSSQISPYRTPELFDAARVSLDYRGDVSTGWSMGWKLNLWARFQDGDRAMKLIEDQLAPVGSERNLGGGGTYPNLFSGHPPYQIDGNFGGAAGIAEMLLQSHDGAIHLLPALPEEWGSGSITGLRARGGFTIDTLRWEDGEVTELRITSNIGGNARLRVMHELDTAEGVETASGLNPNFFYAVPDIPDPIISPEAVPGSPNVAEVYEYDFPTQAGETYHLVGR